MKHRDGEYLDIIDFYFEPMDYFALGQLFGRDPGPGTPSSEELMLWLLVWQHAGEVYDALATELTIPQLFNYLRITDYTKVYLYADYDDDTEEDIEVFYVIDSSEAYIRSIESVSFLSDLTWGAFATYACWLNEYQISKDSLYVAILERGGTMKIRASVMPEQKLINDSPLQPRYRPYLR
jgi:hypothetical protein